MVAPQRAQGGSQPLPTSLASSMWLFLSSIFFFFFKLYVIVLVLPNIKMNPPQVYMC